MPRILQTLTLAGCKQEVGTAFQPVVQKANDGGSGTYVTEVTLAGMIAGNPASNGPFRML